MQSTICLDHISFAVDDALAVGTNKASKQNIDYCIVIVEFVLKHLLWGGICTVNFLEGQLGACRSEGGRAHFDYMQWKFSNEAKIEVIRVNADLTPEYPIPPNSP